MTDKTLEEMVEWGEGVAKALERVAIENRKQRHYNQYED